MPVALISFQSLGCAELSLPWDTFTRFPSAQNILSSTLQMADSSSLQYSNLNIITPVTFPDDLIWNWSPLFTSPSFCAFLSWYFIIFCIYWFLCLLAWLLEHIYIYYSALFWLQGTEILSGLLKPEKRAGCMIQRKCCTPKVSARTRMMKTVRLSSPSLVIPATSAMWVLPLTCQIPGRENLGSRVGLVSALGHQWVPLMGPSVRSW